MLVVAGADVLVDEGVEVTGDTEQGVVGLAHRQEERGVVPGAQLDDVSDQGRRTQPQHMDPWGSEGRGHMDPWGSEGRALHSGHWCPSRLCTGTLYCPHYKLNHWARG